MVCGIPVTTKWYKEARTQLELYKPCSVIGGCVDSTQKRLATAFCFLFVPGLDYPTKLYFYCLPEVGGRLWEEQEV